MKTFKYFLISIILITSCASYDSQIDWSRSYINNPQEKTIEILQDSTRTTLMFRNSVSNMHSYINTHNFIMKNKFDLDSIELYDVNVFYLDKKIERQKFLEIKYLSINMNVIVFTYLYDEQLEKYRLNSIYFGNLEMNRQLRKDSFWNFFSK